MDNHIIILVSILGIFISVFISKGLKIVPQQQAWIIERLGKFSKNLSPGLNWIIPFIDKVAYLHSLKEEAIDVHEQTAITQDNVSVTLDGILYVKIIDPVASSYGVKNPHYALTQLVQTTMRSEIGKIPLDKTFEERESLNANIVHAINEASQAWGIKCMRYEIKDITMPDDIRKAMELQMTAERQKRARILESEGLRQSEINDSEGRRQSQINIAEGNAQKIILESEATLTEKINRSKGEAEALLTVSSASARGIELVAKAMQENNADQAISLKVAEKYIEAFKELAQKGTTVMLPANAADAGSMAAQAFGIFDALRNKGASKKLPVKTAARKE